MPKSSLRQATSLYAAILLRHVHGCRAARTCSASPHFLQTLHSAERVWLRPRALPNPSDRHPLPFFQFISVVRQLFLFFFLNNRPPPKFSPLPPHAPFPI